MKKLKINISLPSSIFICFYKIKQQMSQKNTGLASPAAGEDSTKFRQANLADSLRFSYQFDCDSALQYSQDGQEIDFVFEEFPQYQMHLSNNQNQFHRQISPNTSMSSNTSRRSDLFQKYKIKGQQQQCKSNIIDEFDSIFNMKAQNTSVKHSFLFKRKKSTQQNEQSAKIVKQNECINADVQENKGSQQKLPTTIPSNGNNENIFFLGNLQQNKPGMQIKKQMNVDSNLENGKANVQKSEPNKMADFSLEKTISTTSEQLISNDSSTSFHDAPPSNLSNIQLKQNKNQLSSSQKRVEVKDKESTSFQPLPKPNVIFTFKSAQSSTEGLPNPKSKSQIDQQQSKSVELILKKSQESSKTEVQGSLQSFQLDGSRNRKVVYLGQKRDESEGIEGSVLSIPVVKKTSRPVTPRSMGKSIILESTDPQFKLANPIFDQQNRITPFLRKIRKMNSIYPNFNHPASNLENESKFCNILASIFEEAFKYLQKLMNLGFQRRKQYKYFQHQYASLHYFLNSQWEKQKQKQLDQLNTTFRPRANFLRNQINEDKIRSAMKNYQEVIVYYKAKKIQLSDEQGIKNYFKIRQKFWSLERNLRSISEDVYRLCLQSELPQFYFDYVIVLKSPLPAKTDEKTILYHEKVLNILYTNRQRKQPLSSSQVGQAVKDKLERQLKFLSHI